VVAEAGDADVKWENGVEGGWLTLSAREKMTRRPVLVPVFSKNGNNPEQTGPEGTRLELTIGRG
jgi:hypothetical protein